MDGRGAADPHPPPRAAPAPTPPQAPPPGPAGPRFVVVLVRPRYAGNVGSVARAMANFGLRELWLVSPQGGAGAALTDDPEARRMAMHAWHVLDGARALDGLEAALAELDMAVGTASDLAENEKRDYLRVPLRLRDFAARVHEMRGTVGLVFGTEDTGLTNAELARCDLLVTIPTDPAQPSLNLGHAVAVVAYELRQEAFEVKRPRQAAREEAELLVGHMGRMLAAMDIPEDRQRISLQTFRRLLGRAMPSRWEYHRLMGVFTAAAAAMEAVRDQGVPVRKLRAARRAARPTDSPAGSAGPEGSRKP